MHRSPQLQPHHSGAGLENERERELVGRNSVPSHGVVKTQGVGLGVRRLGEGPDERVEEEGVVGRGRGGLVIWEEDGGGVVDGVEVGGGGGELREDEWVVVEAEFEDEGMDLREGGERVAGGEEGQDGLLCDASFCGVGREVDLEERGGGDSR